MSTVLYNLSLPTWIAPLPIVKSDSRLEDIKVSIMAVDTVTLASGHKMPLVGFGLWKVPGDKAADIVYNVSLPSHATRHAPVEQPLHPNEIHWINSP